ncbi:MAG: response regulator [Bacteriovoracaceae bacterium]|jgi:CheY-like chemotaxis protein|nr:response regulator [Bacteriovoracaceae bacterium]
MKVEGLSLLIVDDEIDLCEVLSWDFEDAGFNVEIASGGHKAIDLLESKKIDVVLTDIKMPEGDGIELLEYIHKNKVPTKVVYLMTGYSDYPADKLYEKGMKKLFRKPVDTEEIIADLESL